jgi:hypothetical protein
MCATWVIVPASERESVRARARPSESDRGRARARAREGGAKARERSVRETLDADTKVGVILLRGGLVCRVCRGLVHRGLVQVSIV